MVSMRWLITLATLIIAVVSLGARAGIATHVTLLLPAVVMLWLTEVAWRPVRPCAYCDRGRDFDDQRLNYGRRCPGIKVAGVGTGRGACDGYGEVLRPGARVVWAFGGRKMLRGLPDRWVDDA